MAQLLLSKPLVVVLGLILAVEVLAWNDEKEEAMALTPNLENGTRIYEKCAFCHTPMGWGGQMGHYPQIAGQHVNVIIKQLADIRAGNRENPAMYSFSQHSVLGGPQNIADVAAYIARLPMSPNNELGPGIDLEHGAKLYKEHCVKCHGANGEGSDEDFYPRMQGQHFSYLLRQFYWIKNDQRHNTGTIMVKKIKDLTESDMVATADFISRLRPPPELTAPVGWRNPDFPAQFMMRPGPFSIPPH
ncbi:cytochrome subunit of sulfide dehydrogenase [Gammaproteobacteria bacterium]